MKNKILGEINKKREGFGKILQKIKVIFKQKLRINTLIIENEYLKKQVKELELALKDKLYEEFIDKYHEPELIEKLTKENKRLRKNNKELKENLKNGE